jgi:uncharacterized protein (TIGR02246 family)
MTKLSVEERLARLEDIEEIRQLKARYAEACDDDHNGERVITLFTPDALWHQVSLPPCNGHDEIKAFMQAVRESGRLRNSSHLFSNPMIEVTGDAATGHWKLVMVYTGNAPDGTTQYHRILGYYDEEYARVDGEWFFKSLIVTVVENNAYSVEPSKFGDGEGSIAD